MFWSGNYIAVRELNFLLKEENVSLTQVLEADDILQECKADNKALIQFLTKPEVLAELITLITEEPPKNVELASQYRHASIACEVLTSHLSTLADRLSLDTVQMNRLCDFINREPPLNPLLASYFSKTVEMLLERSPKQDWYLYHIVCLRVLDFLRARRDFLPNLLRHVATSAVADTFKYLLRLDDLFNKIVMEWLDEHQFLESLIQIICGSYVPEPIRPSAPAAASAPAPAQATPEQPEKGELEPSEKPDVNHKVDADGGSTEEKPVESTTPPLAAPPPCAPAPSDPASLQRMRGVSAANAAALLCDLVLSWAPTGDGGTARLRTVWVLVARLQSEEWVRALLAGMFTSPPAARPQAIVHGCQVLLALLSMDPILAGQCASERTSVELAVAPHLPLLHQALLQPGVRDNHQDGVGVGDGGSGGEHPRGCAGVGAARVHVAALLAQLALSEVEDVPATMITLGTPGALLELFFQYPDNNFLHAQVYALVKHALNNRAYRTQYAAHLFIECDLLTRLMDVFEENENKSRGVPRAGYMGHVVLMLRRVQRALHPPAGEGGGGSEAGEGGSDGGEGGAPPTDLPLPAPARARWPAFRRDKLAPALQQHDTPLGGYFPPEDLYEVENMTDLADTMEANYDFNEVDENNQNARKFDMFSLKEFEQPLQEVMTSLRNTLLSPTSDFFNTWDDTPEEGAGGEAREGGAVTSHDVQDVLAAVAPWETSGPDLVPTSDADWAQFNAAPASPPADPFAPVAPLAHSPRPPPLDEFTPFWPSSGDTSDIPDDIMTLSKFSISATFPDQITETADILTHQVRVDNLTNQVGAASPLVDNSDAKAKVDSLLESNQNASVSNDVNLDVDNDNTIGASTSVETQSTDRCEAGIEVTITNECNDS